MARQGRAETRPWRQLLRASGNSSRFIRLDIEDLNDLRHPAWRGPGRRMARERSSRADDRSDGAPRGRDEPFIAIAQSDQGIVRAAETSSRPWPQPSSTGRTSVGDCEITLQNFGRGGLLLERLRAAR